MVSECGRSSTRHSHHWCCPQQEEWVVQQQHFTRGWWLKKEMFHMPLLWTGFDAGWVLRSWDPPLCPSGGQGPPNTTLPSNVHVLLMFRLQKATYKQFSCHCILFIQPLHTVWILYFYFLICCTFKLTFELKKKWVLLHMRNAIGCAHKAYVTSRGYVRIRVENAASTSDLI